MDLAISIIGLLVIIVPFIITIYNRWFSKKAAERKRRKEEDLAAQREREKAQAENISDAEAHTAQDSAEDAWRKKRGL